jgi:hypothetical protein
MSRSRWIADVVLWVAGTLRAGSVGMTSDVAVVYPPASAGSTCAWHISPTKSGAAVRDECIPPVSCSRFTYPVLVHTPCSIGMSHMAEYTCCSSVASERPDIYISRVPASICAGRLLPANH